MIKPRLVLVGNGMAGIRTLEELLKLAPERYDITVFGAEPHPNYNRIQLSPVLAGEQSLDEIVLNPLDWYAQHGIRLHLGRPVQRIERGRRQVIDADGQATPYDRLLLATGSVPVMLPVPGHRLEGVIGYRDIADTRAMIEAAATQRRAVVIGGGLLGLEAANGLRARGMDVTVVHLGAWLLNRQLDEPAARLLQQALEARGIAFALEGQTAELLGTENVDGQARGRVRAVRLADGRQLDADLVVMAAGIRPETRLAEAAGLRVERGIVVDDTLQTLTDPRIYAVGECVAHRGVAYGLVAPLYEQARVCAAHLAGAGVRRYPGSQVATRLKVTGIELFSAGDFIGEPGTDSIVLSDPQDGVYRKLVLREDRLVGACLYGDAAQSQAYLELIRQGRSVRELRDTLMFEVPAAAVAQAA